MKNEQEEIKKELVKAYPQFTSKMLDLYMDVVSSLGQLPEYKRIYLFGAPYEEDMEWVLSVADYIVLEFIKYSYDYEDPEHSLRYFLKKYDADDSERMVQERTLQYVMKYKRRDIAEYYPDIPEDEKYANIDMDTMEKKLKGYRMTEMNFFEHNTIHDIELIKAIIERRIVSSKKVPNNRFQEMFEQYDEMIEKLIERSHKSDEDMVFAALALYTLEWKYSIETLYYLSCLMEEKNIREVDTETIILLCGAVDIDSQFGGSVQTESRMVKERFFVLDYLFSGEFDEHNVEVMKELIQEILVLGVHYKEIVGTDDKELYKEWFRKESNMKDWASFFRYYNIFAIWEKKEWTRTRIQNMRRIYDAILRPKK